MFVYCKKCALILNTKKEMPLCPACNISLLPVPKKYLTPSGFMFVSQEARSEFESIIKEGVEYDKLANKNRDKTIAEKEAEQRKEIDKKVEEYNNTRIKISCPVCHSEMLDKISNVGKVVKVGVFGILGAGDIGKKYKCKACGYRF